MFSIVFFANHGGDPSTIPKSPGVLTNVLGGPKLHSNIASWKNSPAFCF